MVDASRNMKAGLFVRQSSSSVHGAFAVRPVWPYWTNRRLINGVVDEPEKLMGDAKLEIVIEGVMVDLQVWCDAEDVTYSGWTNFDTVPKAIKRATTYATVAALYARRTKTFRSRAIPTVAPVTVTVRGEDEEAMRFWEDKSKTMLELYLSAKGAARLWVSTADEEPVFSMADIPTSKRYSDKSSDVPSWHAFILEQEPH